MLAVLQQKTRGAPSAPRRFTRDGSDALENRLATVCGTIAAELKRIIPKRQLEGIALGGGYGRGEGGVLKSPFGDLPYNDLEFYVFVRGHSWLNERRHAPALQQLSFELAPVAGVELEFKIISLDKLRRTPPNLFHHDLVMGHRWMLGAENCFAGCEHHRHADRLPLSEATRLLMNRCSGLLFARERLTQGLFTGEDADFVHRNLAKTELALGDALLIASGKYHWSCLVRGQRLEALSSSNEWPWLAEVKKRHGAGIEFKLHPCQPEPSRRALEEHFHAVSSLALDVWLWLENSRLDGHFGSAADYASSSTNKWPNDGGWRNRLAKIKTFGPRALLAPRLDRHPRDRILNALALLLWVLDEPAPELTRQARRELLASAAGPVIPVYRERWRLTS